MPDPDKVYGPGPLPWLAFPFRTLEGPTGRMIRDPRIVFALISVAKTLP